MTLALALLEAGLIGAGTCAAMLAGAGASPSGWAGFPACAACSLLISLCCIFAFDYQDLYDLQAVRSFGGFLARLPRSAFVASLLVGGTSILLPAMAPPRAAVLPAIAAAAAVVLPLRAALYAAVRRRRSGRRTLVLGTGPLARRIVDAIEALPHSRDALAGLVAEAAGGPRAVAGHPVLGSLDDLKAIIARSQPHRIVVALEDRRCHLPARRLIEARVRGIAVEDGAELFERLTGKIAIESLPPRALALSRDFRCCRLHPLLARLTSVLAAIAGLLLSAPLLLLIALLIRLDSGGPILFVQDRMGLGGARFRLLKFRTMRPAGGRTSEWAGDNGDRVTRVGAWLRRFRLDELPQLVNVLRGDMNLIGPRPHPASNFDLFMRTVPYYWIRSMVRPGITGWAQVRYGYADNLEEETEKMRYDLYYIKHRSLLLDARILLDTIKTILRGGGASISGRARDRARARGGAAVLHWAIGPRQNSSRAAARGVLILLAIAGAVALAAGGAPSEVGPPAIDPGPEAAAGLAGFSAGDVLISLRTGEVQWRSPGGALRGILVNMIPGKAEGMAFDAAGFLYVTHYCADASLCLAGNTVEKFSPSGTSLGAFGGGYDCNPYAIALDRAGTFYVGQADCTGDVRRLDASGALLGQFDVAVERRGAARLDLAGDGCTLFYTSQGPNVKRFDVCDGRQLADFNAAPLASGYAGSLRILPDGGVLVAAATSVVRLDSSGRLVQAYDVPGSPDLWIGLDLAGDGTFWASNYGSSDVCRFDLPTGAALLCFNAGTPTTTIKDVLVRR